MWTALRTLECERHEDSTYDADVKEDISQSWTGVFGDTRFFFIKFIRNPGYSFLFYYRQLINLWQTIILMSFFILVFFLLKKSVFLYCSSKLKVANCYFSACVTPTPAYIPFPLVLLDFREWLAVHTTDDFTAWWLYSHTFCRVTIVYSSEILILKMDI